MVAIIKFYEGAYLKYALVTLEGRQLKLAATEKELPVYAKQHGIRIV